MNMEFLINYAVANGKKSAGSNSPYIRRWSGSEIEFMKENLWRGYGYVAEKLGRSVNAIKVKATRMMLGGPSRQDDWYTGNQVANLLGVDIHAVMRWSKTGMIDRVVKPGKRGIIMVRKVTLYRWATRPKNWIHFDVRKISSLRLRSLVLRAQEIHNDPWLSIGQASKLIGLPDHGGLLNIRIHKGLIPEARWNGVWYIPKSVAESWRGKIFSGGNGLAQKAKMQTITRADLWIIEGRRRGMMYEEIAVRMKNKKWNEKAVMNRYYGLKKLGVVKE